MDPITLHGANPAAYYPRTASGQSRAMLITHCQIWLDQVINLKLTAYLSHARRHAAPCRLPYAGVMSFTQSYMPEQSRSAEPLVRCIVNLSLTHSLTKGRQAAFGIWKSSERTGIDRDRDRALVKRKKRTRSRRARASDRTMHA